MIATQIGRIALTSAAALLCACGTTGGRGWIPQAPGGPVGGEARQETAEARAPATQPAAKPAAQSAPAPQPQPEPTRRFDVDPALIAQSPPPQPQQPRRDAAPLPAAEASQLGGYTQATRYGDLLFISGQIALDPKSNQMRGTTIEEQTRQVMENIRTVLEAHRLTMANVVSTTVYMKDLAQFRGMDSVYETYFRSTLPSRSVVQVARLPRDGLVEISVIAGR